MSRAVNFLRGWTTLTVTGVFPERMLNLCAQQRTPFWALEWVDENTFRFRVPTHWVGRLAPLAERTRCTLCEGGRGGLPDFLLRFRRRYALLVGLALSMAAVCVLSNFILTVEVEGCDRVPKAEILTELRRLGVCPGAYGPSIDGSAVGQQALLELDGLSWMSVNIRGSRAEIIVREATPAPEVVDESECTHVVAGADGVITRLEVLSGQPMFRVGEAVLAGEVVISGRPHIEAPQFSDKELGFYSVRAAGRVWADTRRVLTAVIPLTAQVKEHDGRERREYSLNILGRRINFYQNSGIPGAQYDKISETTILTLPGGRQLPVVLTKTVCRAYEPQTVPVDETAARELLEGRLLEQLQTLIGDGGQVLNYETAARREGDLLTLRLEAACREEIGRQIPAQ